jgi:hypothetical protein
LTLPLLNDLRLRETSCLLQIRSAPQLCLPNQISAAPKAFPPLRRQSAMMSRTHCGFTGRAPPPLSPPDISQSRCIQKISAFFKTVTTEGLRLLK